MKKTTLLWDCGTQRIFEEGPHPYAFRTQGYGTPEVLAPLLYLLKHKPDFRTLAVINQDYAWGRDSWELWKAGMDALKPGVRVVAEMFPRLGATDYSTEVTRLLATRPDVILSTSWGGDLVTLHPPGLASGSCSSARPSCCRWPRPRCRSSAATWRTAMSSAPAATTGTTIRSRRTRRGCEDFVDSYRAKFNEYPIYPCHHMAQAISAMQAGFAKAIAAKSGGWPNDQELADAFRGLTFDTPTSSITLREDGQGLEDQIVGLSSFNERFPFAVPKEMIDVPRRDGLARRSG